MKLRVAALMIFLSTAAAAQKPRAPGKELWRLGEGGHVSSRVL